MRARSVDLSTICGGALPELFARELQDVMANIADPNTDPKKPRQIKITVDVYPRQDRKNCDLEMGVTSKTLPVVKVSGSLFIGQQATGKFEGYTTDVNQQDLIDELEKGESTDKPTKPYVLKNESMAPSA